MSPVNGRVKGATFERTVAKLFSDALGVKLRRTPMSGGWSHGNPETAGDLVSVDGVFPYCVECKCSEGWHFETLFTNNHKWFDNWWEQLINECPDSKTPILVFSRARQPIFAAMYHANWLNSSPTMIIMQYGSNIISIIPLAELLRIIATV